jgi:hypothetical protein
MYIKLRDRRPGTETERKSSMEISGNGRAEIITAYPELGVKRNGENFIIKKTLLREKNKILHGMKTERPKERVKAAQNNNCELYNEKLHGTYRAPQSG